MEGRKEEIPPEDEALFSAQSAAMLLILFWGGTYLPALLYGVEPGAPVVTVAVAVAVALLPKSSNQHASKQGLKPQELHAPVHP